MLEFTGTLYRIDQITNYESQRGGVFPERTFVLKYIDPEGREQMVKFIMEPPMNMNLIEDFEVGQQIKLKFYFCGRESVSKFNNGSMNLYEKKRVVSIEAAGKSKDGAQQKNQPIRMPINSYVGPDLTQDFSMFSDTLEF
jgi:hypothetical protein